MAFVFWLYRHSWTVWLKPLDIALVFGPWFTLLTAACQSPDKCQRYDLPLLYWDCLTRPSHLIHPLENPNALIPRGNIFFTIYLAMIYWLRLPTSQRITDPFWEIRFSHISCLCMWHRSPERVRGETDFEEQHYVWISALSLFLCHWYDWWTALWFSAALSIVLNYLLLDKCSVCAWFWFCFHSHLNHAPCTGPSKHWKK